MLVIDDALLLRASRRQRAPSWLTPVDTVSCSRPATGTTGSPEPSGSRRWPERFQLRWPSSPARRVVALSLPWTVEVGLLGLRAVVPTMAALQIGRQPNLLASEALAAALLLGAEILVATDGPLIRDGAAHLGLAYRVVDG